MAQFHLIRHGQASFGAANYDKLSQLGHQQARWLGEYYRARGETFDALVTGDLVRHATFGDGVVTECVATGGDHEVTVEFGEGVGVKKLLLSYAPLEKVDG